MKLSNKLFIAACALGFAALIGEKLSIRAAFADRKRVDFEPGYEEKTIQPFKVVVLDSRLEPNSELRIQKSDRFALASDHNFWKSAEVAQRGDTLFIKQIDDKFGKLADPDDKSQNNYSEIVALCPSGLTAVRSDIGVYLIEINADSVEIDQKPNRKFPHYADHQCQLQVKNCQMRGLKIATGANAVVEIDEKCTIGNLQLMLRDTSKAEVKGAIANGIWLDCSAKSQLSVSGELFSKIKN